MMERKVICISFVLALSFLGVAFGEKLSPYQNIGQLVDNLRKEMREIEKVCEYYDGMLMDEDSLLLGIRLSDFQNGRKVCTKKKQVIEEVIVLATFEFLIKMRPGENYDPGKLEQLIQKVLHGLELFNKTARTEIMQELSHLRARQMSLQREINRLENEAAKDLDVAGTYDTSIGVLVLEQHGNSVTGTYGGHGTLSGIITGDIVKGDYRWNTDDSRGTFEFAFSENGNSFNGKFLRKTIGGYQNLLEGGWNGRKRQ